MNTAVLSQKQIWVKLNLTNIKKSKNKNSKTNQSNPKQGHLCGGMPKQHYGGMKYKRLIGLFFVPAITQMLIIILVLSSHLTAHTQNSKSQEKLSFLLFMKISCRPTQYHQPFLNYTVAMSESLLVEFLFISESHQSWRQHELESKWWFRKRTKFLAQYATIL